MTALEINKALALAIGWRPKDMTDGGDGSLLCWHVVEVGVYACWQKFDYRFHSVIWPIAERYNAFPSAKVSGNLRKAKHQGYPDVVSWECLIYNYKISEWQRSDADSADKAVAMAVIGLVS